MKTSARGRAFISAHEGNPLTAYLDPVSVPTIGHGFTNRSSAVTAALRAIGIPDGKIVPGRTRITAAQSDAIFERVLANEFEPAVTRALPKGRTVTQYMYDAMVSAAWNLGPKFMTWRWIAPWRDEGDIAGSASIWASNYNTAAGKKLPGLVRRRKEEARLFEFGFYTGTSAPEGTPRIETPIAPAKPDPVVREAQEALQKAGLEPGKADGWMGPRTRSAIMAYQRQHPHLKVDGILGPATLAQLRRDAIATTDTVKKVGPLVAGSGVLSAIGGLPWAWIAAGVAIVALGYFAWRYRDVVQRRWNGWRGRTAAVPA